MHVRRRARRGAAAARARSAARGMDANTVASLPGLPDGLIFSICSSNYGLEAVDLANLEASAPRFRAHTAQLRAGGDASVIEAAAEAQLLRHPSSWRAIARPSESLKQVLFIVQHRLPPLPTLAAGHVHTLLTGPSKRLVAFTPAAKWLIEEDEEFAPRTTAMLPEEQVASVAAGHNHSACLTDHGQVWTWGLTRKREDSVCTHTSRLIGRGQHEFVPRRLELNQKVAFVATGIEHTALVTSTGHVFTFGAGVNGCLGHGDFETQATPKLVCNIATIYLVPFVCHPVTASVSVSLTT